MLAYNKTLNLLKISTLNNMFIYILDLFNYASLKLEKDYTEVAHFDEHISSSITLQQIVEKHYNKQRQKRQTRRRCFRRVCDQVRLG